MRKFWLKNVSRIIKWKFNNNKINRYPSKEKIFKMINQKKYKLMYKRLHSTASFNQTSITIHKTVMKNHQAKKTIMLRLQISDRI